jgi:DNA methylase
MTDFSYSGQAHAPQTETANGERNKLAVSDRAFHDWYRFVLSYPPHLVRQYLNEFELDENDLVLDPFCGTGTTVVEAKLRGIPSVGLEANRFAAFAGSTKVNWDKDTADLLEHAEGIRDRVISRLKRHGISDEPNKHLTIPSELRQLLPEQERIILKDSISPIPLHKSLFLLDEINRFKKNTFGDHLRLAFANALVYKISNLRFGPEVGIGKAKEDVEVVGQWFGEVEKICSDLESIEGNEYPKAEVFLSDSRGPVSLLRNRQVSAVITSPPYPNEKDYTRTTRLESVMLGFIADKQQLREMKKSMLRSNTRGVYKEDDDDKFVANIAEIQQIAADIEAKRIELEKTSGFERMYARLTKLYFGGMARHLLQLQSVLKPGAYLAYVVGDQASYLRVMIRTGQILSRVAESIGYEAVRIDQFRTRFSTATKSDLNEEVVILRWPGKGK